MGCGSSREAGSPAAGSRRSGSPDNQPRLATGRPAASQTAVTQSSNPIPSNTTSRAALNAASPTSVPSGSVLSSPRPSTNRPRRRGTADTTSDLSEHYNLPLRRPRPWKSRSRTWTSSQLRRERKDFFDTRVTGQSEVWAALRQVAECVREGDITTAQGILDAVNVTLPTGHVEDGCYDERGCLYRIPEEVLSNPTNVQVDEGETDGATVVGVPAETKAKLSGEALSTQSASLPKSEAEKQELATPSKEKEVVPEDAVNLKCRLSDRGSDITTFIGRTEAVSALATKLKTLAQIPAYARIEIFYLGKKFDQKKTIEEQDFVQGHVLNIFVAGMPT